MPTTQGPLQPSTERVSRLYTFGLPVVVAVDAALALFLSGARALQASNRGWAEIAGYTLGYTGCSLVFCFVVIFVGALLIAKLTTASTSSVLLKVAFWSGLTWVPLFLLVLALSVALRHAR